MSNKYKYPSEFASELNYKDVKVKRERCGTCRHSEVTNAGANIPGLKCKLMERILKQKRLESSIDKNGNYSGYMTQVDSLYGICKKYAKIK